MNFPDKQWLERICKIGTKSCCRYLIYDFLKGWKCGKESFNKKEKIDYINSIKKSGDNCDGPKAPIRTMN